MNRFYDTLLAEYLKNPWQRGLSLDALALREWNYTMISYDEVTQGKKLNFQEVDLQKAAIYSWEDVYITWKLYQEQKKSLYLTQESGKFILEEIEFPLMKVVSQMEITWIKIDRDKLKWLQSLLSEAISEKEKEIHQIAGVSFNINSPKQVGEILFETLWLPTGKKTKTGYSVNAEVLEDLSKNYPIAALIVEYRHYSKLLSTYVIGLLEVADENDRIHTNYNQTIAATGRLSSTDPNLQNIPVWDKIAGEIRAAFIPDTPDDYLVSFDYSQIEVRLLAYMSGDENLWNAFKQGRDIHQVTAEFIFWRKEISTLERKFAKAVNFWVIYGISPFWLSQMIGVSQKDAKNYIDAFYANYPGVKIFYETLLENARKNGYVETLFGRRRYIPALNDRNRMIAQGAEREAINMPIQWSNADIIKIAMIRIQNMLESGKFKSTMLLQVHDELVFNIVPEELEILSQKIPEIMEHIVPECSIPLKVERWVGKNWKECK